MRLAIVLVIAVAGCRSRAVTARYAGLPVAACDAGRVYQPPPNNATTQPFIPLVADAPRPAATAPAPADEPVATPPADDDKPAKAAKPDKKPAKKPAKKKAAP